MQDTQTHSPGHELFRRTKVVNQGRIQVYCELRHLFQAYVPQFKPAGQCLTEPSQLVDIELFCLEGFAVIHGQLTRIGRSDQVLPRWGGSNHHIPGLQQLEEQHGMFMEWIIR
jgi:hypothetical protein